MKRFIYLLSIICITFIITSCGKAVIEEPNSIEEAEEEVKADGIIEVDIKKGDEAKKAVFGKTKGLEAMPDLYFNNVKLPVDKATATYFLPLAYDDFWEKGKITAKEGYSVFFNGNFLSINKKEALNKTFIITLYNNTNYQNYNFIFSNMPIIDITLFENKAFTKEEDLLSFTRFLDSDFKDGAWYKESYAKYHARGFTSLEYPKKSLKMTLLKKEKSGEYRNNKQSLFSMRNDDDWALYAMYSDDTKMRDKLSIDIWKSFAMHDTPYEELAFGTDMKYVEVFINGNYYGLYGLMEKIDEKQLGINKSAETEGENQEYFYMTTDYGDMNFEDFKTEGGQKYRSRFEVRNKLDEIKLKDWKLLEEFLRFNAEATKGEFLKGIGSKINLRNALDYWIFLQVVCGVDNVHKNMIYVAKYENEKYKFYFIPWDMNYTFGLRWSGDNKLMIASEPVDTIISWDLGERLITENINGSKVLLSEKWVNLRKNELSTQTLCSLIDENYAFIKSAMKRDRAVWKENAYTDNANVILKDYVKERMQILDNYILKITS